MEILINLMRLVMNDKDVTDNNILLSAREENRMAISKMAQSQKRTPTDKRIIKDMMQSKSLKKNQK